MGSTRLVRGVIFVAFGVVTGCATHPPAPPPQSSPGSELFEGPGFPSQMSYHSLNPETGTTMLALCVGPNGRVTGAPSVVKSSGSADLDRSAVIITVAQTSGHWVVRRRDGGAPGNACAEVAVQFEAKTVSIKLQRVRKGGQTTGGFG